VAGYRFAAPGHRGQRGDENFFLAQNALNPLKRLDSGKEKKAKRRNFNVSRPFHSLLEASQSPPDAILKFEAASPGT
jgi:hypothetical protein